jgi:hypothetical protein
MLQLEQQMKVLIVMEPKFIVITFAIIGIVDLDQIVDTAMAAVHNIIVNIIAGFVDFNHQVLD